MVDNSDNNNKTTNNSDNTAVAISAQEAVSPGAERAPVDALHLEVSLPTYLASAGQEIWPY